MNDVILYAIPFFVIFMVLEALSYRLHAAEDERGYEARDTGTSLAMGIGSVVLTVRRENAEAARREQAAASAGESGPVA